MSHFFFFVDKSIIRSINSLEEKKTFDKFLWYKNYTKENRREKVSIHQVKGSE